MIFPPVYFSRKSEEMLWNEKNLFDLYNKFAFDTILRADLDFPRSLCTRPTPMQLGLNAF